jgi:DNA polymerase
VRLYLDTETYSEVPIKQGVFVYSEAVETMLISYAVDDGLSKVWDLTSEVTMPGDLKAALALSGVEVAMHNAGFDRTVLKTSPGIDIALDRIHDTMARAQSHSLPGALGKLCEILGVSADQAKDKRGHNLIQLFCKPRAVNSKLRRATKATHPKEWAEFVEYARMDIEALRAVYKKLPNWNFKGFERELWKTDMRINERGCAIDVGLVEAAIRATEKTKTKLSARTNTATGGAVQKTTQRDKLLDYIEKTYGVVFTDLTGSMVEKALGDDSLPGELKMLLQMRSEASTTSTAKYKKFLGATSKDGRLRGMFGYCGASRTGRWSGRNVQLQNLPRPNMPVDDIEFGIKTLQAGVPDMFFDNVMALASNAIRGCLIAAPGKKLVIADLSNIEGRVCAWLAKEDWKLKAFAAYDAGAGPDLYKLAYARAFRIDHTQVDKQQRQIGKVMELMLQYAGGVGAFVTGANAYGINLDQLADIAWDSIPLKIREEAENMWDWAVEQKRTYDLPEKSFIVCDSLKRLWRLAHPGTVGLWASVERAVHAAMEKQNETQDCGYLKIRRDGAWLRIVLPSGRALCYPSPRLDDKGLSYSGVNPYSRKWQRVSTYSGKLVENIVQAVARDILAVGIMNAESAEYAVVLHAHDEIVSEVPDNDNFNAANLSQLMTTGIGWADGLPLAAAGFETYRYRKAD